MLALILWAPLADKDAERPRCSKEQSSYRTKEPCRVFPHKGTEIRAYHLTSANEDDAKHDKADQNLQHRISAPKASSTQVRGEHPHSRGYPQNRPEGECNQAVFHER